MVGDDLNENNLNDSEHNGFHSQASEIPGAGDRIFAAVGQFFSELRRGTIGMTIERLKKTPVEELGLPPAVEKLVRHTRRSVIGKLEDVKELTDELKDYALEKGVEISQHMVQVLDLPTRNDIERLEGLVQKLSAENRELRTQTAKKSSQVVDLPKRSRPTREKSNG